MGIGYTRQSSADIVDGLPITAAPLNNEFNALRDAFDLTNGHAHDGTSGEGPKLVLADSTTGTLAISRGGTGATTAANALNGLGGAPLASPTFTGTPAAPTPTAGTNTTQLATTAFVTTAVNAVPVTPVATGAELRALTQNAKYVAPKTYGDALLFQTSSGTGTFTPDLNNGFNISRTLTGNNTFAAATNAAVGQSGVIMLIQDGTGSRTGSWNSYWDFGPIGVPTLSTAANSVDYVFFFVVSSTKAIATFRSGT